ncbi:hypothetical protein ACMGDH_08615 [Sphingomonas sp. DT-207]|uniref:hypothetical protein n=1 Tax=Sphingomonas sp. DT-207 TaxID=3396167 RepID=UPI003F1D7048
MRAGAPLAALLLAACSGGQPPGNAQQPQDLESAAIERGLVRDPAEGDIAGVYARDADRLCIVPEGDAYRIGAHVDYGDGIACSATGTLHRSGARLRVRFGSGEACSFDAHLDGDNIRFPGVLPDGCKTFCRGRASYAGLEAARMSESTAEARAMRDTAGRRLCGS